MKQLGQLLLLLTLFVSCSKEEDFLNTISFHKPIPRNGEEGLDTKRVIFYFDSIVGVDSTHHFNSFDVFIDTINPPSQKLFIPNSETFSSTFDLWNLFPGTTYYWNISIITISGDITSDVQSFGTLGFLGTWALDYPGDTIRFGETLEEGNDIVALIVYEDEALIKFYGNDNYIESTYAFDKASRMIHFYDTLKDNISSFYVVRIGYTNEFVETGDKEVFMNLKSDTKNFNYTRL